MCGIVGMAGAIDNRGKKMFRDMQVFDILRGQDSTGIVRVEKEDDGKTIFAKRVGFPDALWSFYNKEFDSRGLVKTENKVLIGHNRAATMGKVTHSNAHPFHEGNVVGVHNGSLTSWYELEDYRELDVDSQAIFRTIDRKGIEHTWKSFRGAAALVWWNTKDQTLNIIRNHERPLYYGFDSTGKTLIWASEPWMINVACFRNNVTLMKDEEGKVPPLKQFQTDRHHVYNVTKDGVTLESEEKLEKKPHVQTSYAGYSANTTHRSGFKVFRGWEAEKNWASDSEKGSKETKGMTFRVNHFNEHATRINGLIINPKVCHPGIENYRPTAIQCFFPTVKAKDDFTALWKAGHRLFETTSRTRAKFYTYSGNNSGYWIVSTDNITPFDIVEKNNKKVLAKQKEEDEQAELQVGFKGHRGVIYPNVPAWVSQFGKLGCRCCWCDSELLPEDADEHFYLANDTALCPDCSFDDGVMNEISSLVQVV